MTLYRDIQLKRQSREARKQDKLLFKRAVLTDEGGLQTSADPLNDVWSSLDEKRVWHMTDGAAQPAQILCRKVSDPYVGLGVIIGYAEGSNQLEVLTDDFFLTQTGDPTGWASTAPRDFEPGGLKMMWVYTKVITPLATYPDSTGLTVNIIAGDYPYDGARKTFDGSSSYALTQNPNPGEHYLAGLYLDSANALQVVYGASVSTALDAPEPSWPAGAFRLSAVLIDDTQTSIDFADDVFDRRMVWSDEQAGGGGWPLANILTVSATDPDADYTTIAAAITAASAGDIILLDAGTYTETITVNKSISIVGLDPNQTIITSATNDSTTVTVTAASVTLRNLQITNTGAGTTDNSLLLSGSASDTIVENCIIEKVAGASTNSNAVIIQAGQNHTFFDCFIRSTAGTNRYGVLADTALSSTRISGGRVQGTTQDVRTNDANASITLQQPLLANSTYQVSAGNIYGKFYDTSGNLLTVDGSGGSSGVWQIDESATLKIKRTTLATALAAAVSGDSIKLETDTYSVAASQSIGVSLTIEGDGPEATIYTTSVSNSTAFDITADSVTVVFRNLTLRNTGGGTNATGIFSNNAGVTVILDNCVLEISSGAPTTGIGLWAEAGTWILRNGSKVLITSGTNKYGIYNDAAAATITIGAGCEVGGATQDAYGDQAGSSLTVYGILTNRLVSWAGTVDGSIDPRLVAFTAEIYGAANVGLSDFVATINGAPSGASVVYNAPSSGNEATIVPTATTQLAKMVLHNTTRGDSALISNVNVGTNTITLTANAPGTWQSGDTITIRSQTNTSTFNTTSYFVDFEIVSEVDPLAAGLELELTYGDSGGAGAQLRLHPYKANVTSERRGVNTQSTINILGYRPIPIISNKFCAAWTASGATTVTFLQFRALKQLVYGL